MTATEAPVEVLVNPGESIQDAINSAGPGATVRIAAGTFPESVSITHSRVTLIGAGAGRTVLVPGTVAETDVPALHDAPAGVVSGITVYGTDISDVTVRGLTVRGFSGAGVYAHSVSDISLLDVDADGNEVWGLYLRQLSGAEVSRCRASGSQYAGIGVSFCPESNALIADNETTASAFGIFVDNSSKARVIRNNTHGNAAGILMMNQTYEGELPGGVADCLISDNDITANTLASGGSEDPKALGAAGPPISGVGLAMIGTERVTVVGNRITGHSADGPSVMTAALVLASSEGWGGSDAIGNVIQWNTVSGNVPFDVQIGTDPGNQRFGNNVIGLSEPETIDG